jgi:threonylcarbamoyladenosine tRNA methylthiotransferase MtaB
VRVYLESLGCRLNAAELEMMARHFEGSGCRIVDVPAEADLVVLNSCAVTARASRKSRSAVRRFHRDNPGADIVVTGCWAVEAPERAVELPGVVRVIPNEEKSRTASLSLGAPTSPAPWSPGRWGHTRAHLGVQFGCDRSCTYCITRELRGPARSLPLDEVVQSVNALVAWGAREVVLTGVCLGAYGQDWGLSDGLATLVGDVLDETALPRLRLSSVEPWDVDGTLLAHLADSRLCRHLHLPLQSGSDEVLCRMGRPIDTEAFAGLVESARAIAPDVAISTDVIVGFPGETEADFQATMTFVERMRFSRLHVFPFSARSGTPAARLPDRVPSTVKASRSRKVRALGRRLSQSYRSRFAGRCLPVLWQARDRRGRWVGLTDTYLKVYAISDRDLTNRIVTARMPADGRVVELVEDDAGA